MKTIILTLCSLFYLNIYSQEFIQRPTQQTKSISDTVLFDILNAHYYNTSGVNYIDIPVVLQSNDPTINSFDFWFQFNLNELTYVSTTSLITGLDAFSNFNQANFYLSNTSSGTSINFNIPTNIPVIKLTFQLSAACNLINGQDFSNITTLFDGDLSSYKFSAPIPNPLQVISSLPTCSNNEIIFSYDSLYAGKPIQTYSWDFGNADFSNHQTDSTIYSLGGNYVITLDVVTNDGCSYTSTLPIEILEGPLASFTSTQGSTQTEVIFSNTTIFTAGTITQFHWDFGDGQSSVEENPTVTFLGADTYPVTLTVLADNGCENTTLVNVSTVGIEEAELFQIKLFPNPAKHIIFVQSARQLGQWIILNSQGQVVLQGTSSEVNTAIDIKSLASGTYTIQFFSSAYMFMKD